MISALVITAIIAMALLASNGIGPSREELQLDRPLLRSEVTEPAPEGPGGR